MKKHIFFINWPGPKMHLDAASPSELPADLPRVRSVTASFPISAVAAGRKALCTAYFSSDERASIDGAADQTVAAMIAAKRAVVDLLGRKFKPAAVVIERMARGGLRVRTPDPRAKSVHISIAHTRDAAYALACMEESA